MKAPLAAAALALALPAAAQFGPAEQAMLKAALGAAYELDGRYPGARQLYEQAWKLDPKLGVSCSRLADLHGREGHYKIAENTMRECVKTNPLDGYSRWNLGRMLYRLGRPEEAAAELNETRKLFEARKGEPPPELCLLHGNALSDIGRFDEAEAAYLKALEIAPHSPAAHNDLGSLYARQGKDKQARAELERALRLDPNYELARRNLEALKAREQPPRKP